MWHILTSLSMIAWCLIVAGLIIIVAVLYAVLAVIPRHRHGNEGEQKVQQLLNSIKNNSNIPLNDLLLPTAGGHTTQIDHILVSTRGIFVIETKSHYGVIEGNGQSQYWRQTATRYNHDIYNPLLQNASHIRHLRHILRNIPAEWFISLVVFTDADSLNVSQQEGGKVLLLSDLSAQLKRYPSIIEKQQLSTIATTINKANIRGPLIRIKHIIHAHRTAKKSKNK